MMKRGLCFGLALGAGCMALGCGANISRPAPGPDCSAAYGYEFPKGFSVDTTKAFGGFAFGDPTPRSRLDNAGVSRNDAGVLVWPQPQVVDADPALTCNRTRVVDIQSSGHNDYGSSVVLELGSSDFATPLDASGTTGISFWARAVKPASSKSVIVLLGDRNTDQRSGICIPSDNSMMMSNPGGAVSGPVTGMGSGTSSSLPFYVPGPHDCDNSFQRILQFTDVWTLYLLPFDTFAQTALPNRNPNGIDISALWSIGFQIPKEADFEIWIDQIAAYQPSSADAGP